MRTIHGVGEMMTQMVLSRGSIFPISAPDAQPSIHPSKQANTSDSEDVIVMDTKLKIIEILQVIMIGGILHSSHFTVLIHRVVSYITYILTIHWAVHFKHNTLIRGRTLFCVSNCTVVVLTLLHLLQF